jgi:tetratricopeptide (TPR) repeat protein
MMTDTTLHNQDTSPQLERARLLMELDRYDDLLNLLMPQLDSLEDPEDGYRLCIIALLELKRHDEALRLAEQGLSRHPEANLLLVAHASALSELGMYQRAIRQFDHALASDPDLVCVHCLKASALVQLNRTKEAKEALEAALSLNPYDRDSLLLLVVVEYELGNKLHAKKLVDALVSGNPDDADLLAMKAKFTGGLRQKIRLFREALRIAPDDESGQEFYRLYARQLPIDVGINLMLILGAVAAYYYRQHPTGAWLMKYGIVLVLLPGLYLLKRSLHHVLAFSIMFSAISSLSMYAEGKFDVVTIPSSLIIGFLIGSMISVCKYMTFDRLIVLNENRKLLATAIRCGWAPALLREWFSVRVIIVVTLLALIPTLVLASILFCQQYLLFAVYAIPATPLLYLAAGAPTFWKSIVAAFKLGAWCYLPFLFALVLGLAQNWTKSFLIAGMFLFALYWAYRQYQISLGDT